MFLFWRILFIVSTTFLFPHYCFFFFFNNNCNIIFVSLFGKYILVYAIWCFGVSIHNHKFSLFTISIWIEFGLLICYYLSENLRVFFSDPLNVELWDFSKFYEFFDLFWVNKLVVFLWEKVLYIGTNWTISGKKMVKTIKIFPPTGKQNQRKRQNIEFFCWLHYFKEIGERDGNEVIKIFYEK